MEKKEYFPPKDKNNMEVAEMYMTKMISPVLEKLPNSSSLDNYFENPSTYSKSRNKDPLRDFL